MLQITDRHYPDTDCPYCDTKNTAKHRTQTIYYVCVLCNRAFVPRLNTSKCSQMQKEKELREGAKLLLKTSVATGAAVSSGNPLPIIGLAADICNTDPKDGQAAINGVNHIVLDTAEDVLNISASIDNIPRTAVKGLQAVCAAPSQYKGAVVYDALDDTATAAFNTAISIVETPLKTLSRFFGGRDWQGFSKKR